MMKNQLKIRKCYKIINTLNHACCLIIKLKLFPRFKYNLNIVIINTFVPGFEHS